MEEWRVVEGTKGFIEVSNEGRVRSLLRGKPYILKATQDNKGYLRLKITIERVAHSYKVHRLVANAFIPNPENKPQVNHIDGNKENNSVDNLEWVTNTENIEHAIRTGLMPHCQSERHKSYVISKDRKHIKRYETNGESYFSINNPNPPKAIVASKDGEIIHFKSISDAEGYFNSRHISDVCKGKRQKVKGWSFTYESEVM